MKSLALHLIVTLMLPLLMVGPSTVLPLTAASVSTALPAATATTPLPSPEAAAPVASTVQPSYYQPQRRRLVTSSVTTQAPTTTTMASSPAVQRSAAAGKRQRELIARHSRRGSSAAAAPTNPSPPSPSPPPRPRSSAPSRRASSATAPQPLAVGVAEERARPRSSGVRQNRSLQSASATVLGHSGNRAGDDGDFERKRPERRRINQYTSGGGAISSEQKATSSSTTTTTTPEMATTKSKTTTTPKTTTTTTTTPTSKPDGRLTVVAASNHRQAKQVDAEPPSRERQTKRAPATLKSPRMIQRMVAGHIQNAEGRSTYQISAVSTNSSVTAVASEAASTSASYLRHKEAMQSSSYRRATATTTSTTPTTTPITTISNTPITTTSEREEDDDRDDDEALLDSLDDLDNWDNGILRLSAGSGKESTKSKKAKDDGKTKTLSDQVKDGKYGLIEKELFSREPKRPGVLSYLRNKEVPADNERNYGGLRDEDIWLAEDHLLVIKGGTLNVDESNEPWAPIDDFESPPRQIKIPADAKVPPPFPVQLEPDGPLQFIGNNKFTLVYPVANESVPVYPAGPAPADDAPPPGDGDDAANSLARPGSPAGAAPAAGYLYPPAAPPWLYHNQTFVNPVLSQARPISFPSLGPFPYGRLNASHFNGSADEFDEDDPSLYYPPAYSFVYKSNYSNPVPAGPLVPGIVLPPPADQFSRLEKPEMEARPVASPPAPPVVRHRPVTTTSTTTSTSTTTLLPITTSTSTTTTSTTPPSPIYRPVYTKIFEYTPKTIVITPEPPTTKSPPPHTPPPRHHSTPSPPPSRPILQSVPVAVGVPIPVYPSHRPDIVTFVPTTADPGLDTFSKSNPIYYEYFEAKRQPASSSSLNAIDNYRGSTPKTPPQSPKPVKIYATSKRPFKTSHQQPGRNYLQPVNQHLQPVNQHLQPVGQQQQPPPPRAYLQDNIVYITPKPEIRYNVAAQPQQQQQPIFKQRPLENFEREVDELRETLRFYHNQQLRDNTIPRTPKAKPVYEYAYDGNKQGNNNNNQPQQQSGDEGKFQPSGFDEEPFQPMVTYSRPVGDENAFRAIAYDKVDNEVPQSRQLPDSKYPTTTTLVPVQPDPQYQQPGRPKKLRLRAKYLQPGQLAANAYEQQQQGPVVIGDYQTTPRVVVQPAGGQWQEFNDYGVAARQPQKSQRLQLPAQRNRGFNGYYYNAPPPPPPLLPPQQHTQQQQQYPQQQQQQYPQQQQQQQQPAGHRQNNRFYDEPFQSSGPQRKIVNYAGRPQPQPQWSLENDTYVNYAPNRPPLNPDAEFIDPYRPVNVYAQQPPQRQPVPPPLSHQSQYYSTLTQRYNSPRQQQQGQQQQQQQQIPLHRDILVNYRDPLPPINPDSEYITHPQVVRQQGQQIYRPHAYRGGDQASVYYISPKYRRSPTSDKESPSDSGGK